MNLKNLPSQIFKMKNSISGFIIIAAVAAIIIGGNNANPTNPRGMHTETLIEIIDY